MSQSIKDLMTTTPHTVGHDIAVTKAMAMMKEHKCHHLPVLDAGQLVGLISYNDLRGVDKVDGFNDQWTVEDFMSPECVVVDGDQTVKDAVQSMLDKNLHSVIVKATNDHPWGIFTSTDALRFIVNS